MANNAEIQFINMAPELAKAQRLGFSGTHPAPLRHRFFSPGGGAIDLLRRLRSEGFDVVEDDESPTIFASRSEPVDVRHLKSLVRDMCELADKHAADYDGWKIAN